MTAMHGIRIIFLSLLYTNTDLWVHYLGLFASAFERLQVRLGIYYVWALH